MTGARLVVAAMAVASAIALDAQVIRSTAEAVLVDVSVTNKNVPVPGLGVSDFEVQDNEIRQTISSVTRETWPVDATVLLDVSGSARAVFGTTLSTAAGRVRALFLPTDRSDVVLFGAAIVDADHLQRSPVGPWATLFGLDRGTALFDAIVASAVRDPAPGYRRLVVVLTDGMDTASFVSRTLRLDVIDRSGAVIDIVGLGPMTGAFQVSHEGARAIGGLGYLIQEIASRSGGRFFDLGEDRSFVTPLRVALDEFRARYVIAFTPTGVSADGWHELRVSVPTHPKSEVNARRGYFRPAALPAPK